MQVYLSQELLAYYRRDLFKELDSAPLKVLYLAGNIGPMGIRTILSHDVAAFRSLRNIRLGPVLWQAGLLPAIVSGNPEVVVLSGDYSHASSWVVAMYRRALGKPVLFWTMGWRRPDVGVKRLMRLAFYNLGGGLLLYGEGAASIGREMGYRGRIHIVGNSVPTIESHPRPAAQPTKVGFVSRLTPARETEVLLHAVARMISPVGIIIGGDGPEMNRLQALGDALCLDVTWLGPVDDPETLRSIYSQLAVCVIPGAAGLAVIQSLQFGVPVLTHNDDSLHGPEVAAIEKGVTGDRFRRGNADELAVRIQTWTNSSPSEAARISTACQSVARNEWSTASHAAKMRAAIIENTCLGH